MSRLSENNMKINIAKCFFGNTEVNYLGFRLTPEGIKPGKDKLKAAEKANKNTEDAATAKANADDEVVAILTPAGRSRVMKPSPSLKHSAPV